MNRILLDPAEIAEDATAVFGGVRAEHVLNVLHGELGQVLKTGVVDGPIGTSVVTAIEPLPPDPATGLLQGRIRVQCSHDAVAVPPWVDLLLAPPRPRALKRLLPQLAQLGVGRIVLVGAEKVEKAFWGAQLLKPEVHRSLLLEGLMQAGTTAMPVIEVRRNFRRYLEGGEFESEFGGQSMRMVAHPYGVETPLSPTIAGGRMVVAIGPEGGWTEDEVAALERHGFARVSLGPRILRTDTACVALLARLMSW